GLVGSPSGFVGNVLDYSSSFGSWGVTLGARLAGVSLDPTDPTHHWMVLTLKAMLVAGVVVVAFWTHREKASVWHATALAWLVFFTLASGVGAQYFVWPAPFVLLAAPRLYGLLTAAATMHLIAFYGVTSDWHFNQAFSTGELVSRWTPYTWPSFVMTIAA